MIQKLRTKQFWISLAGVIIMLLQLFGVKVNAPYVNEVINGLCAVLIVMGLMTGEEHEKEENADVADDSDNEENGSTGESDNEVQDEIIESEESDSF